MSDHTIETRGFCDHCEAPQSSGGYCGSCGTQLAARARGTDVATEQSGIQGLRARLNSPVAHSLAYTWVIANAVYLLAR